MTLVLLGMNECDTINRGAKTVSILRSRALSLLLGRAAFAASITRLRLTGDLSRECCYCFTNLIARLNAMPVTHIFQDPEFFPLTAKVMMYVLYSFKWCRFIFVSCQNEVKLAYGNLFSAETYPPRAIPESESPRSQGLSC